MPGMGTGAPGSQGGWLGPPQGCAKRAIGMKNSMNNRLALNLSISANIVKIPVISIMHSSAVWTGALVM